MWRIFGGRWWARTTDLTNVNRTLPARTTEVSCRPVGRARPNDRMKSMLVVDAPGLEPGTLPM